MSRDDQRDHECWEKAEGQPGERFKAIGIADLNARSPANHQKNIQESHTMPGEQETIRCAEENQEQCATCHDDVAPTRWNSEAAWQFIAIAQKQEIDAHESSYM